jgi:Tfp pilus assembly protein PilX
MRRPVSMRSKRQEGIALVITLLVMTILLVMGSAFMSISSTETLIAINERNRVQAYHLAEAGAEMAIAQLNVNGGYGGTGGEQALGIGTYRVDVCPPTCVPPVTAPGNLDQRMISARGCVRNCTAAASAVAQVQILVERRSQFPFALLGFNAMVELKNGVEVDSYDSALGDYGAGNISSQGHVHSNTDVKLGANNTVSGNAQAVTSIQKIGLGNIITGTETTGVPSVTVNTGIPFPPYTGYGAGINPPAAFDGVTKDLTAAAGQTVTLAAGTYSFNKVTLDTGAKLAVTGDVVIYMTGQFMAKNGAVVNTGKVPANLLIYSNYAGTGATQKDAMVMDTGSGEFYGGIYALNGEVKFRNGGWKMFGAIVARDIDIGDSSRFHYDMALRRQSNLNQPSKPVAGTWREVLQ